MAVTKYFFNSFGVGGDLLAIPNNVQGDGSVSYYEGWGFDYQRDLATDGDARPVPRPQMNQLFYDITQNIQQYQQLGFPNFISTADNEGSPFEYEINAVVRYLDKIYLSLVGANDTLPTDDDNWLELNFSQSLFPTGGAIPFRGLVAPDGWLKEDGTIYNIVDEPALFEEISNIYGGDGITTFAVPDMRGRVNVGSGGPIDTQLGNAVSNVGGFRGVELTDPAQNAPHLHNTIVNGRSTNSGGDRSYGPVNVTGPYTLPSQLSGGGMEHDNMQPSMVCLSIIKT